MSSETNTLITDRRTFDTHVCFYEFVFKKKKKKGKESQPAVRRCNTSAVLRLFNASHVRLFVFTRSRLTSRGVGRRVKCSEPQAEGTSDGRGSPGDSGDFKAFGAPVPLVPG